MSRLVRPGPATVPPFGPHPRPGGACRSARYALRVGAFRRADVTYTLIPAIDLLEAVRRYGQLGRVGVAEDAASLPFNFHHRRERPSAAPITFIELQGGAYWLTVGGDRQANTHYCAVPDGA